MHKTTVYLPEELKLAVEASAKSLGISQAEFMRCAIKRLADEAKVIRRRRRRSYTLLPAGSGSLTVEEMDEAMCRSMRRRASKR
jgi:Arc/MetJ-type ribon-helix-helix transcriptional regulator